MFLKNSLKGFIMGRKNKKADIKTVMWIAFIIILFLFLVWMVNRSGWFSNQMVANLKEKLNPFS